ncbi:MAG TPA: cupin domain-containing protein [Myxococcota bacterium]|jgi:quercetin dioxygenase-like cupin family protein
MAADPRPLGDVANRLLFENELVRVWEMNLAPGERSDRHRHDLPYVLCVLEGARVDAEVEGRGNVEIPVQPGSVFFVPPGATETAVNNSSAHFREILIELKQPGSARPRVSAANVPGEIPV